MDTTSIWNAILNIPLGTLVAWIAVIFTIITGLSVGMAKLYKLFDKYRDIKEDIDSQKLWIGEVNESLKSIKCSLDEQKDVNLKQIRYTIVHICDDALAAGNISAGKLKSLEEMFEEYIQIFHANGYVKTLVKKVRALPVVGKLDE